MPLKQELLNKDQGKCEYILAAVSALSTNSKYSKPTNDMKFIRTAYNELLQYCFIEDSEITAEAITQHVETHINAVTDDDLRWVMETLLYGTD